MKSTSLETGFINRVADSALLPFENSADAGIIVEALPFDGAYDLVSTYMRQSIDSGHVDVAITLISGITTHNAPYSETIKDAARQQILAAAMIEEGDVDGALVRIADALHILSEYPKRRDTAFRSVLALLLYDLALIHAERKEFHAAERTINKAIKLFEVLAKTNPDRYASAHVYALNVATSAYRSRIKQVNLLAHYQVATSTYISMAANGAPEAVGKLVDSLVREAETLLNLGKPRDAVRYLSRALKYLDKIDPSFSLRKLKVSVMLGEALLHTFTTRQKGVHLLNTLLQKAKKMDAAVEVEHIGRLLDEKTTSLIDILSRWHKIFSRD